MSFDLGALSRRQRPPEQPGGGLRSRFALLPDPFHIAASLARNVCLCGVWRGYRLQSIMTFNRWPTIVIPPPFFPFSGKPHIARHFTSPCHRCFFPSCSSYPAKIIGRICHENKSQPRLVRCIIGHGGRGLLSWRRRYIDTYKHPWEESRALRRDLWKLSVASFHTSSWAQWVFVLHVARCIDPWICYHVTLPVLLLPALMRINCNGPIKISLWCLD